MGNYLIPAIVTGIGLVLLGVYIYSLARIREAQAWPATQGTVVASWARRSTSTDEDGVQSSTYYPEVQYTYTAMGATYQNDKISFGMKSGGAHRKIEKYIEQYPINGAVTVYYDPNDPQKAILERKTAKRILVYGLIMLAVGIYMLTKTFGI